MRVNDSSFSKTFGILQNWFTSGKTFDCSGKGFGFGLYRFVYVVKRPLIISSILRILRQSAKCLNSYFSSCFILQTTCPRSSVTPTLAGPGGRRPPDMWRSRSRSPAEWWSRPGWRVTHAAWCRWWHVLVLQPGSATRVTSTLPTQTHLLLPMAPQWSDWAEGVLSWQKSRLKGIQAAASWLATAAQPTK